MKYFLFFILFSMNISCVYANGIKNKDINQKVAQKNINENEKKLELFLNEDSVSIGNDFNQNNKEINGIKKDILNFAKNISNALKNKISKKDLKNINDRIDKLKNDIDEKNQMLLNKIEANNLYYEDNKDAINDLKKSFQILENKCKMTKDKK